MTAGLKPGDRIIVNGLQRVRPGALLKTEVAAMGARGRSRPPTTATRTWCSASYIIPGRVPGITTS